MIDEKLLIILERRSFKMSSVDGASSLSRMGLNLVGRKNEFRRELREENSSVTRINRIAPISLH